MKDKIKYFFPKVLNRFASEKNRIWEHLPVEKISLWGMGRVPSKEEFTKLLQEMLGVFTPEFFAEIDSQERETIISCADNALNHDFYLLGSGLMHLDPIPWHSDFKSGYTWPKGVFYRKLPKNPAGIDLKMPRELSRCHHLLWLGEAYLISGEEKYASEVTAQIDNWIDENPLMYSVNWECAMDVAIRAVNWMYALNFILASKCFTDEFAARVCKSLFQHGFLIKNNLEKVVPYSNNHYFSDIVGLLYLGKLFKNTCRGRRWLRYALKHYRQEVLIETMPSGVNFERSVSYHRLMAELMVYPYAMLIRSGYTFDIKIIERLTSALSYINNYTKDNGLSPLVADNDDGRLLPFVYRDFRKHGYLTVKDSSEMRIAFLGLGESNWLEVDEKSSCLYQDANVAVLRAGSSYLFTSCCHRWRYDKNTGGFVGVHLHNDLLSFVYSVGGNDIVVDPGAYVYTPDIVKRNEFRSTAKHNTIMVDGEEQNILSPTSAFSLKYNTNAKPLAFCSEKDAEHCEGEYATISGRFTHHRSFDLTEGSLSIHDVLTKAGADHTERLFFHLAEGCGVSEKEGAVEISSGNVALRLSFEAEKGIEMKVVDDTVSPSYGVLKPSKTVVVTFDFAEKAEIITKFTVIQ